ncbi:MAG: Ig-like domain-containing protein [Myxococcales bacterium]|nr:Ig-like domain-containing protein [Myxococcales bacterium]
MINRNRLTVVVLVALTNCSTPVPAPSDAVDVSRSAVFANGGFEGDAIGASPSSWTVERYLNNRGTPLGGLGLLAVPPTSLAALNLTPDAGALNTSVVGGASPESVPDPNLGAGRPFRYPKFGTRSVVVNPGTSVGFPTGRSRSANSMKQTMTLTAGDIDPIDGNIHIRFVAAPVLEDPGHAPHQQPYFFIQLRNVTRDTVLYTNFNFAGQVGVPWQTFGEIKFTDWQLIDVAPGSGAVIGEQVEMIVFAAGCSLTGHWGRVYVDAFGSTVPGLYVTGSAPTSSPNNTNLTYTLNYRNGSTVTTNGTQVVFNAPPNTTLVSTTQPGCAIAANTLTCPLGAVAAGAGGTFNVVVNINSTFTGLLTAQDYRIQATGVSPLIGSKIDTIVYNGPATLSVVSGSPQSSVVNTQFGADLVVEVLDRNSLPIPGLQVTFTAPGAGASASTALPFAITGANGRASIRPTANTVTGSYSVTASVPGIASTGAFTLTNTAGAPASVAVVSGSPQSATINAAFGAPLLVVVRDAFGNAVPGATVTFAAPGSGASASLTAAATTNALGQTQVTPTANATAGAYSVTASVAGVMTPATFALTNTAGAPASLSVVSGTPQTTVVNTAFALPLVVIVRDVGNNPVSGVAVTFTPPGAGASATITGTTTTNAAGQVSVTATANTVAGGPFNVTASVGAFNTTFALTNTAGAASSISVVSGSPQSGTVNTAFGAPLIVVVRDAFGNPVAGRTVTFTPPAAGASSSLSAPAVTNAAGQTQVAATANTTAGAYSVTASTAGVVTGASFALTNTAGAAASIAAVSGTPQSTTRSTAFGAPLIVVVRDAFGNPVAGRTVTFTPPGSGASAALSAPAVTNAAGQTQVTATANATAGAYSVAASTAGVVTSANFALTNTAGAPASIATVSGTPQSTVVNTAFGAPLVVVVRDSANNPVPGVVVTFTAPATGASAAFTGSTTTNAAGQVSITATANTVAGGPFNVTATVGGFTATFVLTNTAGAPASVTVVSGSSQSAAASTAFGAPLIVVVRDAFGNPVAGRTVTFTPPAAGASAVLSAPAVTNAAGQTQVTATANGTAGGPYTIAAATAGVTAPANFALTNTAGAPASISTVSGTPQTTVVNTAFGAPLVVVVRDAANNPISGATVTFTAPATGASATFTGSTTTNAAGQVSITATANTVAGGPFNVTATVGAFTATFVLTNTAGAPASVTVVSGTPQSAAVSVAFGAPLIVVVRDAFGNPVAGRTVTFTAPAMGASAALSTPAVTNAAGQAQVTATANATPGGPYSVTASTAGVTTPATFALTNTAGAPASIATVSGTPQTTVVNTAFGAPLVVVVRDSANNPVPGVVVTFTAPATGASAAFTGSTTTDASGQVSLTATANSVAGGPYNVTVTVGTFTATFVLTNTAGAASAITVVSGSPQSTSPGSAFGAPLVVRVTDADGNPVPNATVTFTPPSSGATAVISGTLTTGANGEVSATATANATSGGPYQVTASVAGVTTPATFSLTNTAAVTPVITTPTQNAVLTDSTPDVSGTAGPNAPVSVFADGGTTPVCTTTADAMGAWTCTVSPALSDGPHVFVASTVNGAMTASSPPRTVIIDATPPPVPVITVPAEGSTTSPSPTVSGVAEPGSTVRLFVDGSTTPACTAVTNAAGNYTCVIPGPLTAGAHTLTATATDAAGNTSAPTPVRNFTVVTTTPPGPPVIAAPAAGSSTNDTTPTVSGTATPGSEVRVYVDGSMTPACTATASATGAFTCDVSPALAPGPHSVVATATTTAGTSAPSNSTPFTVDTSAPAAPVITAPAMNATTSTTPTYAGTSEPNATVQVFVDGGMTPVCTTTANAMGAWSCASSTPLTMGAHTVTASATDAAGNTSSLTAPTPFTVAAGQPPPAPVVSSPIANAVTSDATPAFEGTATPGSTVNVFVDGGMTPVCTAVADTTGRFVCAPTTPLTEGPHTVTATATTGDGTSPSSTGVPFTVDSMAPPLPVITSPTVDQVTSSTPTITGTAEAGSTVTVRVDGQVVCEVVASTQGAWSCPVTQPLAPGAHTTTARATDAAGNVSMTTPARPFTVAGTPTTPVLQQPAAGSSTSNRTPTYSGLADPGSTVTVRVDGMTVCTTTADAMGRFSCTPTTPLSEGPHSATVTAVTPGGMATSVPTMFTVTPGTPMAPVITSPSPNGTTTSPRPEFKGTAEPGSTVTVRVDGMTVCTTTADASGQFSCTPTTPLSPGPHSVTATATNPTGTSPASTSVPFTVPTPPVLVTPGNGTTTNPRPSFSGTGRPNSTISVVVDGAVVCTAVAAEDGSWSCTPESPLSTGGHEVVVKDGPFESGVTSLTVVERSLSGGGVGVGCASTGGAPGWWLLALVALGFWRRRAAHAPVRLRRAGLTGAAVVSFVAGSAFAQPTAPVPGFELERVRLNGAAAHGLLVESADLLPKYGYRAALTFHYQQDPLVLIEDGKRVGSVVSNRIGLHLSGAFTITDWLDVSLQFPIILSQSGNDLSSRGYTPVLSGVAAGTPWIAARAAPWQERRGDALDVSFGVALGIPLGSEAAFTKDSTVSAIPSVAVGKKLSSFWRLGGSVGFLLRGARQLSPASTKVSDEVGSLVMPSVILSTMGDGLRGELSTRVDVPFTRSAIGAEVDLGLRYPLFKMLEVYVVGGPGFGTLPGTPTFRVLAGVALAPAAQAPAPSKPLCVEGEPYELAACPDLDLDGDGVLNGRDTCPRVVGLAARAGCPDVDTDGDGIFDSVDKCPAVPGVKAYQGCPVPDSDKDGIVDDLDKCPTIVGLKQYDGCPVPDADGDGVLDEVDACPTVPGVLSERGCPEVDTDGDGVMDPVDACRTEKGVKENAGCPAAKKLLVVIAKDRIIIREKVNFATGKSVILPKSFPLLAQVSQILKDHPEVERVSIEGHTDGRGARAMNLKLSEARAESVRQWLIKNGIDAARITAKGFGPDKPIGSNDTDAGREQNRRVEFLIVGAETVKE